MIRGVYFRSVEWVGGGLWMWRDGRGILRERERDG